MVRLSHTDLEVYPLCLGGNVFGWTADEQQSFEVLDAYAAAGGNFIDTADSYSAWVPGHAGGESESIIGRWMTARGTRQQMIIATKVGSAPGVKGLRAATIRAAAEASLRRLGIDRIDLYYAHVDDPDTPLEETLRAFDALVKDGKCDTWPPRTTRRPGWVKRLPSPRAKAWHATSPCRPTTIWRTATTTRETSETRAAGSTSGAGSRRAGRSRCRR